MSGRGWDVNKTPSPAPVQTEVFFEEDDRAGTVIKLLREKGERHIDQLATELNLPVRELSSLLFELEMNGRIKALPGNIYKLM